MAIHQKLNHISFRIIKLMAANGHYPKWLIDCRVPKCSACLFGKSTSCPWWVKAQQNGSRTLCTYPGQCVLVDQLESPAPGLIAQLKGIPTTKRYKAATIFVDHFSRLSFVRLQSTLTSEDTLQAKKAFEKYSESNGVQIKHYHADNGRFVDKTFTNDVIANNQQVTYCGVNAHFQNGVAEKQIQDLQDLTQTAILHASARRPKAFSNHLWPYALRYVNETIISVPKRQDGKSAVQIFADTSVFQRMSAFRPFGCPVYILDNNLQAGMKISKWQTWAHVGLYPRHSPMHAKTVVLVLNLTTGLVSPQFHIKYDDFFETVNNSEFNLPIEWKTKCHFVKVPIKPQEYPIEELTSLIEIVDGSIQENADQQIPLELIPNTVLESHQGRENGQEMQTYPTPLESMSVQSPENQPQQIKWSQRHKPSTRLLESREQAGLVYSSIFDDADGDEEIWLQINIAHPIAYAVSTDPDTMYMEQAMLQPDRKQFLKAMADEVNAHTQNGHWRLILRSEVPPGIKVLPSV